MKATLIVIQNKADHAEAKALVATAGSAACIVAETAHSFGGDRCQCFSVETMRVAVMDPSARRGILILHYDLLSVARFARRPPPALCSNI